MIKYQYFCDKCGRELTSRDMCYVQLPFVEGLYYGHPFILHKQHELCLDCLEKLKKWIDEDE